MKNIYLIDKLRSTLLKRTAFTHNADIKLFIERTLTKYEVLECIINYAEHKYGISDTRAVEMFVYRFMVTQGTLISKKTQDDMEDIVVEVCAHIVRDYPNFDEILKNESVDDVAKTLLTIEEIEKLISLGDPLADFFKVACNIAAKLKKKDKTYLDIKSTFLQMQYFNLLNDYIYTYDSFIEEALLDKRKKKVRSKVQDEPIELSSVLTTILANIVSNKHNVPTLASFIITAGKLFVKMCYMEKYRKYAAEQNKGALSYTEFIKNFKVYSSTEYGKIGSKMLDLVLQTGVIHLEKGSKKGPSRGRGVKRETIAVTRVVLDTEFYKNVITRYFNPAAFPLLTPPARWSQPVNEELGAEGGGKQLERLYETPSLVSSKKTKLNDKMGHLIKLNDEALRLINKMQEIPFIVDNELLQYITDNAEYVFIHECMTIQNYDSKSAYVESKNPTSSRSTGVYSQDYNVELARAQKIIEILAMATLLSTRDFYFPAMLDFRGRCYFPAYPLAPQDWYLAKFIIKMKSSAKEVHLDVKSSVIQIILGHMNDPFNKLYTTKLYRSSAGFAENDIYLDCLEYVKNQLAILAPQILDIKDPVTKEVVINRAFIKTFIMKNLYSQSYSGLVDEFKRDYSFIAQETKKIMDQLQKTKVVQIKDEEDRTLYERTVILPEDGFDLPTKEGFNEYYIIPSLITKYLNKNHPELLAYKKFFKHLAKYNGDKPLELTMDDLVSVTQYYTAKTYYKVKAPVFSKQKTINILVEKEPLEVDIKQTDRATGVNFTHATDALIMYYTIKELQEHKSPAGLPDPVDVIPSHDGFRLDSKHIDKLNKAYAKAFHKVVFQDDLLKKTYENILQNASQEFHPFLAKEYKIIQDYREMGNKHFKEYNDNILEQETKKHITVGFLDKYKKKNDK